MKGLFQIGVVKSSMVLAVKDEITFPGPDLRSPLEDFQGCFIQGDRFLLTFFRIEYSCRSPAKIYSLPGKRKNFTETHSGIKGEYNYFP